MPKRKKKLPKSPSLDASSTSPLSSTKTGDSDNEDAVTVTMDQLEKAVERAMNRQLETLLNKHLNDTIESLRASLQEVTTIAKNALKLAEEQKAVIDELRANNKNVKTLAVDVRAANERIEERTNRQLRKTLVFHGIQSEGESETWEETEKAVRKTISEICDEPYDSTDIQRFRILNLQTLLWHQTGPAIVTSIISVLHQ